MPEDHSDTPVKITATPRAHPAIRVLARACIALARWQREQDDAKTASPVKPQPPRPPATEPGREAPHA